MALWSNIIVVLLSISAILVIAGYNTPGTDLIKQLGCFGTSPNDSLSADCNSQPDQNSPQTTMFFVMGTVAAAAAVFSSLFFPNPWLIFSPIFFFFLMFFTMPYQLLMDSGIPAEIRFLVGVVFGGMYLLSILDWHRGGGG